MEQPIPPQPTPSTAGPPNNPIRRTFPGGERRCMRCCPLILLCLIGEVVERVRYDACSACRTPEAPSPHWPMSGTSWLTTSSSAGFRGRAHSAEDDLWHTRVTIDSEGFRSHPRHASAQSPTILAVGDSFTFGAEVNDDGLARATWSACRPARREYEVGGSGIDQIVLRTELVRTRLRPDRIVVASCPGDIGRCGCSSLGTEALFHVARR